MGLVLHDIEKRIIDVLRGVESARLVEGEIAQKAGLSPDQLRRGIEWLRHKGLVNVGEFTQRTMRLGSAGEIAATEGLPERRLVMLLLGGPRKMDEVASSLGEDYGPALGAARSHRWIAIDGHTLSLSDTVPPEAPEELIIRNVSKHGSLEEGKIPANARDELAALIRRPGMLVVSESKTRRIKLTDEGRAVQADAPSGQIDVEADAPAIYPARTHPLKDTIDEVRETFVTLGFSEVAGALCQPGFWNFDALFTPQDHPAREMQDTFYLESMSHHGFASAKEIAAVSAEHKRHWGAKWSAAEARKSVLRTHTTCVTLRHLAEARPESARVFSLGRVFRNEKVSYKHLVEFNQVEGVVVGPDVTLRGLMGIQREFYRRMGMDRVKFWPTFFPYTEPSLQSMVYSEALGKWIELFGMGIFRPEVTRPLGIKGRVLAWGGGIERIAMLRSGLSDVRELYANRLAWLRGGGA